MNIAIVDISTKNHASLIENWIKVSQVNGWNVELYISTSVFQNLDSTLLQNIKVNEFKGGIAYKFLNSIYQKHNLGEVDKVVITSLQSDYFSFLFSGIINANSLLTLHNINVWNGGGKKGTIKFFVKSFVRKLLISRANSLLVSSTNLANALKNKYRINKKIYIMPFKLAKENINKCVKKYVVYPGIISNDRKEYEIFLKLCQHCEEINFILLGKAGGEEDKAIVNKFKKLPNVVTFDKYVTQDEFKYYMDRAAVVFGGLNVAYEYMEYIEVYGETKDTGLSYFTVENRIPLLINKDFENVFNLQSMTFYYSSFSDAKSSLLKLIEKPKCYTLEMLPEYRLCNVAKRLYDI